MYFELKEEDALDNLLKSFRTYIYRKKILGYHKENYLNIIEYIKKLLDINIYDKTQINALIEDVKSTKVLTEKDWIIYQLEKMLWVARLLTFFLPL